MNYENLLTALCDRRQRILHAKHLDAWRKGYFQQGDVMPSRNEYSITSKYSSAGKAWQVMVDVYRKEHSTRRPWVDRELTARSVKSKDDAWRLACIRMLKKWEPLGEGCSLEEAALRLSVEEPDVG